MEDEDNIQNWEKFVREIKSMFSNKSKTVDAKWKIEIFKQSKKHIADFLTEFGVLAIKAETDDMQAIFLLKKNI